MAQIPKDWIGTYFEKGVDFKNRRLFLIGDVDEDMLCSFVQGMKLLEAASTKENIEVYIATTGGDMYDMFGIYDVLRSSTCHVKTISMGKIMSAGVLLAAAGDESLCYRNTIFMSHEMWWSQDKSFLTEHENEVRHSKELKTRWLECFEDCTKTPASKWRKFLKDRDFYFDAVQAEELGIVDKIITQE